MCSKRFCSAEKLINIALPVADVDTAFRVIQKSGGLGQVFEPADTLLLLNRYPRVVDFPLECVTTLKFTAGPELQGCQAERKASGGHRQAGMHLNSAHDVVPQFSVSIPPSCG